MIVKDKVHERNFFLNGKERLVVGAIDLVESLVHRD